MSKITSPTVSQLYEDPLAAMRMNAKLEILAGAMEDMLDNFDGSATDDLFVAGVGEGDDEMVLVYARRDDARSLIAWATAYAEAIQERAAAADAPFEVSW